MKETIKDYKGLTRQELIQRLAVVENRRSARSPDSEYHRLLHDLPVPQGELETQNHELREAQLLLEGSRDRYADFYDFAPVGLVTFDRNGLILEANLKVAGMLGLERFRLVGVPFHLHIVQEDLRFFREHLGRISTLDERVTTELRLARQGGDPVLVVMQSVLYFDRQKSAHLCRSALTDITARKLIEQSLHEKEVRLRAILDTAIDGIIAIDERGTIESFSRGAEKLFGYSVDEVIGKSLGLLLPSPFREQYVRYLSNDRDTGERKAIRFVREVSGLHRDGTVFPLELSVGEVQLDGRRIFAGFVRDLTQRNQAEEALRTSEARFRLLSEASPVGICMADKLGLCTYVNPRWEEMSGLKFEESLGDGWTRIVHPHDRSTLSEAWSRSVKTNSEFTGEFRIVRPDGVLRWIRARSNAILGADGQVAGYVSVDEDITQDRCEERRRKLQSDISQLLTASESLVKTVPKLLQVVANACEWDVGEYWSAEGEPKELRMLHVWHRPGRKLTEFVRESLRLSISMFDGMPARVMAAREADWVAEIGQYLNVVRKQQAARAGLHSALAFPILLENQVLGVIAFLSQRAAEPDAQLLQMFVNLGSQIGQFVERKRTEQALREANEFGRQVIAGAQAGIVVYDRVGRITVWNPFMESLSGYRSEEMLGRHALEVIPIVREQDFEKLFEQALLGEVFRAPDLAFDLPARGKRAWVTTRFAPLRDAQKEIVGVIVAVRDITERRRLESELLEISDREQQRIGFDLHDGLGQRLTSLEMKCFLLLEDLAADDLETRRKLLKEQAQKINEALRECITSTRALVRGLAPVSLKSGGLTGALKQLAHFAHVAGKVECRFICRDSVKLTSSQTAAHLYRIAQEAVSNALKHARSRHIQIKLIHRLGVLRLQITDDGRGLPKNRKPGSGMGLEVMRHRAHVIGASLDIDSKPAHGLSVVCTLPLGNHEH